MELVYYSLDIVNLLEILLQDHDPLALNYLYYHNGLDDQDDQRDQCGPDGLYGQRDQCGPDGLYGQCDQCGPDDLCGQCDQCGPDDLCGQRDQCGPDGLYGQDDPHGQYGLYFDHERTFQLKQMRLRTILSLQ